MKRKRIIGIICVITVLIATVNVYAEDTPTANITALQQQIALLEAAIDRSTPEVVAEQWAKAQMTRNSALEYALLSEKLRSERLADYEAFNFFVGTSSPYIGSYLITGREEQTNGSFLISIELYRTTSTRERIYYTCTLTIEKDLRETAIRSEGERWCISSIQMEDSGGVATGLLVSNDDTEIPYDVVSISEDGNIYERGISFSSVVSENIPYVALGSMVQMRFYSTATGLEPPDTPATVALFDCILTANGKMRYSDRVTESIPIKFENGIASFMLKPNRAALLSSHSADYESGMTIRGFRLVCKWEDKSCEYIFALRSDAIDGN